MNDDKKYIAYYRVSTEKQKVSGLGLDAQKAIVQSRVAPVEEYVEYESGKNNNRPVLHEALEACKKHGATLIVAKLDRLSRDVEFVFSLRNEQIDFRALDMPEINTLILGMFATVAQHERETISSRVKVALAELKKKGVKLGNPQNLTDDARAKGREVIKDRARKNQHSKMAYPYAKNLKDQGMKLTEIMDSLNKSGYKTPRGKEFTQAVQVSRLLKLYETG